MEVKFLSNAPCGFYKYKYPKEIDGKVGAKVSCVVHNINKLNFFIIYAIIFKYSSCIMLTSSDAIDNKGLRLNFLAAALFS